MSDADNVPTLLPAVLRFAPPHLLERIGLIEELV